MRILVLGGTAFLSAATAGEAVRRGHEVVCACRGLSGQVPEGASLVMFDRDEGRWPAGLAGFDAVVDVARTPSHVRAAVTRFSEAHWVFVSTCSVYADHRRIAGTPRTTPVVPMITSDEDWRASPETYGGMKAACESIVRTGAASSVIVRPGLIGGPGDPSGRFTYWPVRLARAGPVLAPPQPDLVQVIDVRDLARWLVTAAERRTAGVFDAVGIALPRQEFLTEVARGVADDEASPPPEMVWASSEFLASHGVAAWSGPESLPMWLPGDENRGFMARDARPALLEGLELRPLAETARDTLAWVRANPEAPVTGLSRSRERELVAAWLGDG